MGYSQAGFTEIVGVDIVPQPNYPFEFHRVGALGVLEHFLAFRSDDTISNWPMGGDFDLIHASPPCQAYSRMRHLPWLSGKEYPELIEPTRLMLQQTGLPWVMENVEDAPLATASTLFDEHGTLLCGRMFDLALYRHRKFESSFPLPRPDHPRHEDTILGGRYLNKRYSQTGGTAGVISVVGHTAGIMKFAPTAMGIDWMKRDEITQAIPPAYTKFIGEQFLDQVRSSSP